MKGKVDPITCYGGLEGEYSFLNLGAKWVWVVNATPRPLYPWKREPVPIV
jgi:hypothetical protein